MTKGAYSINKAQLDATNDYPSGATADLLILYVQPAHPSGAYVLYTLVELTGTKKVFQRLKVDASYSNWKELISLT